MRRGSKSDVAANDVVSAIEESEEKFRAMFEQAPIGILQVSQEGQIEQVNRAFCDIGAYQPRELVGQSCFRFLDTRTDLALTSLHLLLSAEQKHFGPLAASYLHSDLARVVPLQLKGIPFRNQQGEASVWLFVEDVSHEEELREQRLVAGQIEAVGELASHVGQELGAYLDAIRSKTEQILLHERNSLSATGLQELTVVVEQCGSLQRLLDPFLVREQGKVVARQGMSRLISELRLRLLRGQGGRALRSFLVSSQGRAALEQMIAKAAQTSSEAEGMALVYTWLLQQEPPLLPLHNSGVLWARLQSSFLQAIRALREGASESAGDLPLASTQTPQVTPISTPQLPDEWRAVETHLFVHYRRLQLGRWCKPERFQSPVERWLDKAFREEQTELSLEPLWEELQRLPELDPVLLAHYFQLVAQHSPSLPLKLPPLLSSSAYNRHTASLAIDGRRADWDNWQLLPLPWHWQEALVGLVDGFLRASLSRWCDPIDFEQFLSQRMAWFLVEDSLDLNPLQAFLTEEGVPAHASRPFLSSLAQDEFPWKVSSGRVVH